MNKNEIRRLFAPILFTLAILAPPSHASSLSLVPITQSITSNGTAAVDLIISGLGDVTSPSLGAFLVEITFDESILSFDSVTYGSLLGNPSDSNETDIVTTLGTDSVSLDEFSFLFDFELDVIQPASFTLATLQFTGNTTGTSTLEFGALDLSRRSGCHNSANTGTRRDHRRTAACYLAVVSIGVRWIVWHSSNQTISPRHVL